MKLKVVSVEGMNGSGTELIASKIIDDVSLALDLSPVSSQLTEPLTVVIACGPFSTTDNLLYEPLNELILLLDSQPPDVLILIGPFVDAEHPLIKVPCIAILRFSCCRNKNVIGIYFMP
jgi:DNA polymerase alpha subunit B